jgi:hypothetical protein
VKNSSSWLEVVRRAAADPSAPMAPYRAKVAPSAAAPIHLGRRHLRSTVAGPAHAHLPLHAKVVPPMNLDKLLADMRPHTAKRLRNILDQLKTKTMPSDDNPKWRIPADDLAPLIASGVIHAYDGTPGATFVRYFSVLEQAKNRRRPIMWPKDFLGESPYFSELELPAVPDYTSVVNGVNWATCFDLASSFWQVLLPADCVFVMVDHLGRQWRVDRVPFGVDSGSEILQIIVDELAHMAATRAGVLERLTLRTHVDNVLCGAAEQADVLAWKTEFLKVADYYGVTLNDEPEQNAVSQRVEFAGIVFDFATHTVSLRKTFITSIPSVSNCLASFQSMESALGKLIYGAAVLRIRLHRVHFLFKWWRRQLSQLRRGLLAWSAAPSPTRYAMQSFISIYESVRANRPVRVPLRRLATATDIVDCRDDLPILVCDATLQSYGCVLYENGFVTDAYGQKFNEVAPSMAAAESGAVLASLERFKRRLAGTTFVLLVDNTTAEHSIVKGRAKDFAVDFAVDRVDRILREINAKILVGHIASADNVADAPSRAKPLVAKAVLASRAAAQAKVRQCAGAEGVR